MALVVSTTPPEVVVRAKVNVEVPKHESSPGLCDSFWACMLNDYLDEENTIDYSETFVEPPAIISQAEHEKQKKREKKRRRKEKKKRIIMAIEKLKAEKGRDAENDQESLSAKLEDLLSDDAELDIREDSLQEPISTDDLPGHSGVTREANLRVRSIDIGPEEEVKDVMQRKKREEPSSKVFLDDRRRRLHPKTRDSRNLRNIEPKFDEDVIQYASRSQAQSKSDDANNAESATAQTITRIPIDPEVGERRAIGFEATSTAEAQVSFLTSSTGVMTPSADLQTSRDPDAGTAGQKLNKGRRSRKRESVRNTVDLTSSPTSLVSKEKPSTGEDLSTQNFHDPLVAKFLLESQESEKEYRRRKLDRKEALKRIRAIKARLQAVDP